jgi:uncharacterized protein (TIGR02265 family)
VPFPREFTTVILSREPQVKGSNVLLTVKALRGRREVALKLLPPELHHYLESKVLQSSWYSESDHEQLMRCLARMLPQGEPECWRFIGCEAAKGHVAGPYKVLVAKGPDALFASFQSLWRLIHTTGDWQVEDSGVGRRRCRLDGFAVGMPEFGPLMEGYFAEILRLAGARHAEARCTQQDDSSATFEISWQSAAVG